ncbi:MAG: DNA/RNA nuclease SfsA [Parvibaculaceae bacterium]
MVFPSPLVRGTLLRRYKRFLADVELEDGSVVTVACPNTGSMMGLVTPGVKIWLSVSASATRKYPHTWELIELEQDTGPTLVGINTGHPNRVVSNAIRAGEVPELHGYSSLRNEVKYGRNSRIDILLEEEGRPPCYVEVKNVHLSRQPGRAEFPDSVTARGAKHLQELSDRAREGDRAVMFFLVQRDDARSFALAGDIDPAYAVAFKAATQAGVEALAYCCRLTPDTISLSRRLPFTELK